MAPNIEKSAFRRGEYVGYGGRTVWHIRRSNSSSGNWCAFEDPARSDKKFPNVNLYGFTLKGLSEKLAALPV